MRIENRLKVDPLISVIGVIAIFIPLAVPLLVYWGSLQSGFDLMAAKHAARTAMWGTLAFSSVVIFVTIGLRGTSIHHAARTGQAWYISEQAAKGRKVDRRNLLLGQTPLHVACKASQPESVRVLLSLGARIDVRDRFGRHPKELAKDPLIEELMAGSESAS